MPEQYNPESILQEQFGSQREQIQKHFQTQWDEVNNRARAGLFKSEKDRDGAFFEIRAKATQTLDEFDQKVEQATGQFEQIDRLAKMGAIKDPDEVKWRMVLGPEAEKGMFPAQANPYDEYRKLIATEDKVFWSVKQFALGSDKKLYEAKVDKNGDTTNQPDKTRPASQEDLRGWIAEKDALYSLRQARTEAAQNMAAQGIENPNRLQDLFRDREEDDWFKKIYKNWWPETKFRMRGGTLEELKRGRRTGGTFGQKVQETIYTKPGPGKTQPRTQAPQAGKKLTKEVARRFRMQYGNQQDAMAAARAEGYVE